VDTNGFRNAAGGAASDPWGGSSYGPAALSSSNAYTAAAAAKLPALAHGAQPLSFPPPAAQGSLGASAYGAMPPEPLATPQGHPAGQYSFASPFPTSVAAPQHQYTPATQASSIGFASPIAQPYGGAQPQQMNGFDQTNPPSQESYGMNGDHYGMEGFSGAPVESSDAAQSGFPEYFSADAAVAPEPAPAASFTDPALLSMSVLSGTDQPLISDAMENANGSAARGSLVDQAYAKLVNMDAFDLVQDKGTQSRKNPFEFSSTSSNNTSSLADIMKTKSKAGERKDIMKSYAPAPGSLVVSSNQTGNFGGYGSQYGLSGMGMTQPQQPAVGGISVPPPVASVPWYGGMQQQQQQQQQQPPSYGQPQAVAQSYGQAPGYGMQSPPPMQMPYGMQQHGQPPPMQQQQYPYGQAPSLQQQQQPFGY
jgi:hypothetical protein